MTEKGPAGSQATATNTPMIADPSSFHVMAYNATTTHDVCRGPPRQMSRSALTKNSPAMGPFARVLPRRRKPAPKARTGVGADARGWPRSPGGSSRKGRPASSPDEQDVGTVICRETGFWQPYADGRRNGRLPVTSRNHAGDVARAERFSRASAGDDRIADDANPLRTRGGRPSRTAMFVRVCALVRAFGGPTAPTFSNAWFWICGLCRRRRPVSRERREVAVAGKRATTRRAGRGPRDVS